jgi:hypothetical protein
MVARKVLRTLVNWRGLDSAWLSGCGVMLRDVTVIVRIANQRHPGTSEGHKGHVCTDYCPARQPLPLTVSRCHPGTQDDQRQWRHHTVSNRVFPLRAA